MTVFLLFHVVNLSMTVSLLFHVVTPSMSVSHIYFSLIYTLIDFQISQERVNTSVHE